MREGNEGTPGIDDAEANDNAIRISPLVLRAEPGELLRRRQRLFSEMRISPVSVRDEQQRWLIQTLTVIPATTARISRDIPSSFEFVVLGNSVVAFIAQSDSDTYVHSIGRIESSCYPLAIRPYLPVEIILKEIESLALYNNLKLEVMHMRAVSRHDRTKMQLHGPMSVDQVINRVTQEQRVLQAVRLRADKIGGGEGFRLRVDNRCRLMVEKWQLPFSRMLLTEILVNRFLDEEDRNQANKVDTTSHASSVYAIPFSLANNENGFKTLAEHLQRERGLLAFALDARNNQHVQIVDFASGFECTLSALSERFIGLTTSEPPQEAFLNRLNAIVSQVEDLYGA